MRHYYLQAQLAPPLLLAYWIWQQDKPWRTGTRLHDLAHFYLEADSATLADQHLSLSLEMREQKMRALQCYSSQKIAAGKIFRKTSRKIDETFTLIHPTL